jgi:transcriptional regulator with XRE-family HTH domain
MLEPSGPDAGHLVAVVAGNVRRLRERAGLSLGALAASAGVGKSTLSLLESGRANPSIETLWAIGRALGVPFGELLEPAAPQVRVVRAGEGIRVDAEGTPYHARLLASSARRGSTELYVLDAEPGPPRLAEPHVPGVVEHLLVVRGGMRVGPREAPVDLAPGDLASFDGAVPHVYETTVPATCALLWMDYA